MEETASIRILLVDSDIQWIEHRANLLQQVGFEVLTATSAAQALRIAKKAAPELLLLNIFLPDTDGVEVCEQLPQMGLPTYPIVVLLAEENQDYALLAGFEAGADDFIYKNLKPKLFIYKLQALVRCCLSKKEPQHTFVQHDDFSLDPDSYTLLKGEERSVLPKKEFELLSLLLSAPEKLFTREELALHIWGDAAQAKNRTIDVHIRKIREKIGQEKIKTIGDRCKKRRKKMIDYFLFLPPFSALFFTSKNLCPICSFACYSHFFYIGVHYIGAMSRTINPALKNSSFVRVAHGYILSIGTPTVSSFAQTFSEVITIFTVMG